MLIKLFVVLSTISIAFIHAAEINIFESSINILNSETKPGNLLPNFLFQQGSIEGGSIGVKIGGGRGSLKPFIPDEGNPDDIFEGAMEDERSPQLPYLTQDLWTCDRKPEDIPVWVMEDSSLKVTVTPQYAGKVWGIFDKTRNRELLFANRAHQPANIAALKAWAAGGSEWNWSPGIIGHSAFSETQVYLTQVDTERGPMFRVHEFDRYNGTVWQVDMLVNNGTFLAHPRITNPTPCDLRGYWWTCVAVDALPTTRIFAPATHVAETSRGQVRDAPWPFFAEAIENGTFSGVDGKFFTDNSWLGNHQIGDMFLRIPDTVYTPYVGHTNQDGFVYIHGHPLNGTKFFTWGDGGPGRFMQDFLAGGGKRQGDYTELQVGPAPTQMQNFPVPAHSIREWTEWFRGFDSDPEKLAGDYNQALSIIDNWIRSEDGMQKDKAEDWEAFFSKHATDTPSAVLVHGQPWGALEEMRLGSRLAPGLTFDLPTEDSPEYEEARPWVELLQKGTFSDETLSRLPLSYQTTDGWFDLLSASSEKFGLTWLHALHIAIGSAERGNIDGPKDLFRRSFELKPNPIAARCLGVLQSTSEQAWPYLEQAWLILHSDWTHSPAYYRLTDNLVTEISFFLVQAGWYDKMEAFLEAVPEAHRGLDAYLSMRTKVLLHQQRYSEARQLLSANCFPTYAKARDDLMNMWNTAVEGIAAQKKGSPLTYVERHQARMQDKIPANIGCQYASEYCVTYW